MEHVDTTRSIEGIALLPDDTISRDRDQIPLSEIVGAFRRNATTLTLIVVASAVAVLVTASLVPKQYTASTTLSVVPQSSATDEGEIGAITARLTAIASTNLNSDPKKIESLAKLRSNTLLKHYITKYQLISVLFPNQKVSLSDAAEYFDRNVRKIITDPATGFVDLTISWKDPVIAAEWANGLVAMENDIEREASQTQSRRTIAYLSEQAAKTDNVVIRRTLNSLIASELNKSVVAQGTREFSFKVVDRAVPPEKYSYPKKMTWLITACLGSFSVSIFVLFCRVAWRREDIVAKS